MTRKMKNIIMITLIIVLGVLAFFTADYSRNDFRNRRMVPPSGEFGEMGLKPEERPVPPDMNGEGKEFIPDRIPTPPDNMNWEERDFGKNDLAYTILFSTEMVGIIGILLYLIASKFNKISIQNPYDAKQTIIAILIPLILGIGIAIIILVLPENKFNMIVPPQEEETSKETTAKDVESGTVVFEENINLEKYDSNITITKAGSYTLEGEYKHSILVNADGEVTLNLNNVIATNNITAAIANISKNSLIINLPEGTTNILTDGGSSEYDACIYSAGPLTITGSGNLGVYGKQDEGEGIATETNNITINGGDIRVISNDDGINAGGDGGTIEINDGTVYIKASGDGIDSNRNIIINGGSVYAMGSSLGGDAGMDADQGITINGGDVIALGSDMLEKPNSDSLQRFLAINLSSKIEEGEIVSLKNEKGEEVTAFKAGESFRTLIISNEKIKNEKYVLYKNGEMIDEI